MRVRVRILSPNSAVRPGIKADRAAQVRVSAALALSAAVSAALYTLKMQIKLPDLRKTSHMGSVWVLFLVSTHTRPIYPAHFAGEPYTARITSTITCI